mgnify:CR=1 FL=1
MKISTNNNAAGLEDYRKMVVSEWGEIDSFNVENEGIKVSLPILAQDEEGVIGGLSFTRAEKPDKTGMGLWVNTLYVVPNYRYKGIGTKLLLEAVSSIDFGSSLYVLADVPSLYINCGWYILSRESANYVPRYKKPHSRRLT